MCIRRCVSCPSKGLFDVFSWLAILRDLSDFGRELCGGYLTRLPSVHQLGVVIDRLIRLYNVSIIRVSFSTEPLKLGGYVSIDTIQRRRAEKVRNRCKWFHDGLDLTCPQLDDFDYLGIRWMHEGKFGVFPHPTEDYFHPAWTHPDGLLSVYDL
ncbi:uncharacterized protein LOC123268047 [Cotesia glomerata]|uniref:Uncharacterized protein n=1 Tax=Cotesia glomerata TaxID=32391 RepID=A0AAV7HEK2_COTGL|nr:uncharacterized protein LOC123268047 [Cotesia glomerata]KAH0535213.1 hypothetical protein KQX54_014920 [Cotesia glomerata]